ncbi:hypothetical protein ACIQBJ_21740 [Kitasatospora sp. NPDC088391]|uniref:hypothetical protein n=1 Tax=Kitasatospora sp. NPDC088391 TaxID=3364074 RepID=UPI00381D9D4B
MAPRPGPSGPRDRPQPQEPAINTPTRRSVRVGTALTVGAVALTTGLAACSTVEQLSAGDKLGNAFEKLGDAKSLRIDLSFDATPEQVVAFGKAVDSPIEQKAADLIGDLKLSVTMTSDKPLKDSEAFKNGYSGDTNLTDLKGVAVGYTLSAKKSGKTYADIRLVDRKMYVKADVRGIAGLAGEDPAQIDRAVAELPSEAAPVKDVIDGKWLSVDLAKLQELSEQAAKGGKPGSSTKIDPNDIGRATLPDTLPGVDGAAVQEFAKSLKEAFSKNVTLEEKGRDGDADVIRVSAPLRPLVASFTKSAKALTKGIPGYPGLPTEDDDLADVPDRKLSADVRIKDGRAQAVLFDLAQLDDKTDGSAHLPLRIGFSGDAAPLTAPSGATEFDLDKLKDLAGAMAGAADDSADDADYGDLPATELTADQLAELAKLGVDGNTAGAMARAGLSFEEMKQIAPGSRLG